MLKVVRGNKAPPCRLEFHSRKRLGAVALERTVEPSPKRQRPLRHAATRFKWIVSTEHTHWSCIEEMLVLLIRPLYQISECKRLLSGSMNYVTKYAAKPLPSWFQA